MNGNNLYYLFERDLTSNHVSYHFCFKRWENFNLNGKLHEHKKNIFNIFERNELFDILENSKYHKSITPENKFISSPYFHMTLSSDNLVDYQRVNQKFHIKTNFKYNYFTKLISDLEYPTNFKCGFPLEEYKMISHNLKQESFQITSLFKNYIQNLIYAFDFTSEGDIIQDNINVEIVPKYSKNSFLVCKEIIKNNFNNIDSSFLNKYDLMFENYDPYKFHFHLKFKLYKSQKPTIKFYRSYNSKNPYLNY